MERTVLIVEDDPNIQLLLESVFEYYNVAHSYAGTIALAKQKIENTIPGLIILDNSLPDGRGVEFIEYLNEKYPCIGIIIFTSDYIDIEQRKLNKKILLYAQKPSIYPILNLIENINWHVCDKQHRCFPQNCLMFP
jgi:response regulator of citrate/malate metabolism